MSWSRDKICRTPTLRRAPVEDGTRLSREACAVLLEVSLRWAVIIAAEYQLPGMGGP